MLKSYQEIGKQNICSINNQVTYLFLFQINLLIFQNSYEFFQFFLRFSKFFKAFSKTLKKIEKIRMDSKKSINSFQIEKDTSPDYLWNNSFFCHLLITFRHKYNAKYIVRLF